MAATANRILIVEDEPRTMAFLSRALRAEAISVGQASGGHDGLRSALDNDYDLVILDLRLPELSGIDVLHAVHGAKPDLPVLILSAQSDIESKLRCFDRGATDFLAKPFALSELIARVRVHLGRRNRDGGDTLRVGPLSLHLGRREVAIDDVTTHLAESEFRLLYHLMQRPGAVVSRQELLAHVWGYDFDPGSNVVDVCIMRLRRKLGSQLLIETVRKVGYALAAS